MGRYLAILAGAAMFLAAGAAHSQEASPQSQQPAASQQAASPNPPSLGELARKLREQHKESPKSAKVWDNDNLPKAGDVSVIGAAPSPQAPASEAKPAAAESKPSVKDEKYWRHQFAEARAKLQKAQGELAVLQREYDTLRVQYYPDPQKTLMQAYTQSDLIKKQQEIQAKQEEVQQLQQAISGLEDQLRQSGGDPGWAR